MLHLASQVSTHPYHHQTMPVSVPVSETSPNEVPSPPLRRPQHPTMSTQAKDRRHSSSPMQLIGTYFSSNSCFGFYRSPIKMYLAFCLFRLLFIENISPPLNNVPVFHSFLFLYERVLLLFKNSIIFNDYFMSA